MGKFKALNPRANNAAVFFCVPVPLLDPLDQAIQQDHRYPKKRKIPKQQ